MDLITVAHDLITRLDQLIAEVSDDDALSAGLRRERRRLVAHLADSGVLLGEKPRAPAGRRVPALAGPLYQALFHDVLDGRRFDTLMLLSARARRRDQPVGSPSLSLSRSPAPSGPSGPSALGGGASGTTSCRRKRSKDSTSRTWA